MRAVTFLDTHASVIRRDDPGDLAPDDLRVRVLASSINGSDRNLRTGTGLMKLITSRTQPGFDVCGEVVACGDRVTAFEVGDRVIALLDHSGGGQAELVDVPQSRAATAPTSLDDAAAAALPLAGLTALQALRRGAALHTRRDAELLVVGAAGGIGAFGVQLGIHFGARVTAVVDEGRADFVRSLGAHAIVDRRRFAGPELRDRFDVVLDAPGTLRFASARGLLRTGGTLVSTRPVSPDTARLLRRGGVDAGGRRFAVVTTAATSQDLALLGRLVEAGALRVPVDRVFALDEVAAAYAHAESGRLTGKVVITVTGGAVAD